MNIPARDRQLSRSVGTESMPGGAAHHGGMKALATDIRGPGGAWVATNWAPFRAAVSAMGGALDARSPHVGFWDEAVLPRW